MLHIIVFRLLNTKIPLAAKVLRRFLTFAEAAAVWCHKGMRRKLSPGGIPRMHTVVIDVEASCVFSLTRTFIL